MFVSGKHETLHWLVLRRSPLVANCSPDLRQPVHLSPAHSPYSHRSISPGFSLPSQSGTALSSSSAVARQPTASSGRPAPPVSPASSSATNDVTKSDVIATIAAAPVGQPFVGDVSDRCAHAASAESGGSEGRRRRRREQL